MEKTSLIIPAFKPDSALIELVESLKIKRPLLPIIIVNDGSGRRFDTTFTEAEAQGAIILKHTENQGKGAALSTAFNYWKQKFSNSQIGVVTADADGQHCVEDIELIFDALISAPNQLHLGSRQFDKSAPVPIKSFLGNRFSAKIFSLLTKQNITDTQTGLRGIGRSLLELMLVSKFKGYEFELVMLFRAVQNSISICQHPISTIYLDNNASSHFKPIADSYKIYKVFWHFMNQR